MSCILRPKNTPPEIEDPWIDKFLAHLATDRGASIYTQRNYRQALGNLRAGTGPSANQRRRGIRYSGMIFVIICVIWAGAG